MLDYNKELSKADATEGAGVSQRCPKSTGRIDAFAASGLRSSCIEIVQFVIMMPSTGPAILASHRFAMTMLPLKLRTVSVALPSP